MKVPLYGCSANSERARSKKCRESRSLRELAWLICAARAILVPPVNSTGLLREYVARARDNNQRRITAVKIGHLAVIARASRASNDRSFLLFPCREQPVFMYKPLRRSGNEQSAVPLQFRLNCGNGHRPGIIVGCDGTFFFLCFCLFVSSLVSLTIARRSSLIHVAQGRTALIVFPLMDIFDALKHQPEHHFFH